MSSSKHNWEGQAVGVKLDSGKSQAFTVIGGFSRALSKVAAHGTVGNMKYTKNGWLSVPNAEERYKDAAVRHLLEYMAGHQVDREGFEHLTATIWNLLAVSELIERREEKDDE